MVGFSFFHFLLFVGFEPPWEAGFCLLHCWWFVFQAGRFITSFSGWVQQSILFGPPCPARRLLSAPVGCASLKLWGLSNQCQVGVLLDFELCVWAGLKAGKGHFIIRVYSYHLHCLQACKAVDWMYSDLWLIPRGAGNLILGRWAEKIRDDFAQRCSPLAASLKLPSCLPILTSSGWCHRLCHTTHVTAGGSLLTVSKVGKFRVEQVMKTFSWGSSLWAEMEPNPGKGLAGGIQNKYHMEQGTDLKCSL